MTYSPATFLAVRARFQQETGLPAVALGIQHYSPQGGGYHEGNDLLAQAGRLNTDYSKRQSERDRPGSNAAMAIDIGRFSVVRHGRVVDNHFMTRWLLDELNAGAPDTLWIREVIYSLDDWTVQRWDRLGHSTTGDSSHRTHEHISGFRDEENSPNIPGLFNRFWNWVNAGFPTAPAPSTSEEDDMGAMFHAIDDQGTQIGTDDEAIFAIVGAGTIAVADGQVPQTLANKLAVPPAAPDKGFGNSSGLTKAEWNALMDMFNVEGHRFVVNADGTLGDWVA